MNFGTSCESSRKKFIASFLAGKIISSPAVYGFPSIAVLREMLYGGFFSLSDSSGHIASDFAR